MDTPPAGTAIDAAFAETADRFVASRLPDVLATLTASLRSMRRPVARCGMLVSSPDGTALRLWVDSDGRVLPCPETLCKPPAGSLFERCRTRPLAGLAAQPAEPVLDWCADGTARPRFVLAVASRHECHGYLVIETHGPARRSSRAPRRLPAWAGLAVRLVESSIRTIRMLVGSIRFARDFTLMRDRETGEHQLRLGAYLRILAREMQAAHGLPDSLVHELTLFGPLHDIGKIGIADDILLKPGRFDEREWQAMKRHVEKGSELVQHMCSDLALDGMPGLETLMAVVAHHHEYLDGSGYPEGRCAPDIPIAARMVTVVDIFDALTCMRPYKRSWPLDDAYSHLRGLTRDKIDRDCYRALHSARRHITEVWRGFHPQAASPA